MCLFLALFSFLVLSAASPHALREIDQAGNHTKPHERRYHYEADLVTWPQDSGSFFHTIPYCFQSSLAFEKLSYLVYNGIDMWTTKLGVPGKTSGHALKFEEIQVGDKNSPFCWVWDPKKLDKNGDPGDWAWNPLIDLRALVIMNDDAAALGAVASVGYAPPTNIGEPQNYLTVGPGSIYEDPRLIPIIAHELGHTLGLLHENQRSDRDKYLSYDCRNVIGYDAAVTKIAFMGHQHTIDQLCNDEGLAILYGFSAARNFATILRDETGGSVMRDMSTAMDFDSIMMYGSLTGINPAKMSTNMKIGDYPLTRWKNPDQASIPAQRDDSNSLFYNSGATITDLDKQAVGKLYPWRGS